MRIWRIKHIPTGNYFSPRDSVHDDKGFSCLGRLHIVGKIYHTLPKIQWAWTQGNKDGVVYWYRGYGPEQEKIEVPWAKEDFEIEEAELTIERIENEN